MTDLWSGEHLTADQRRRAMVAWARSEALGDAMARRVPYPGRHHLDPAFGEAYLEAWNSPTVQAILASAGPATGPDGAATAPTTAGGQGTPPAHTLTHQRAAHRMAAVMAAVMMLCGLLLVLVGAVMLLGVVWQAIA